jgi:hypothetical protein
MREREREETISFVSVKVVGKGEKHTTKCLNARGKKTRDFLLAAGRTNTPTSPHPSPTLPPKCFCNCKSDK